jgi:ribosomal-protein-alanine N-acetyltransferase
MYNIKIVPTLLEHIDDIMLVERLSFKIPWSRESITEEIIKNKLARYFSVKVNDRVVGYAGMWCVLDEGHITNVAVHPEFRNIGLGVMLIESLIGAAKSEGVSRLTLEVRKSNTTAQNLYRKFGFEECGVRKSYYADNGEDAIIMWKDSIP